MENKQYYSEEQMREAFQAGHARACWEEHNGGEEPDEDAYMKTVEPAIKASDKEKRIIDNGVDSEGSSTW